MGWAVATCLFWAGVLGLTFPKILSSFGSTGAFGFFAALNMIAFVWIFLWVPETKVSYTTHLRNSVLTFSSNVLLRNLTTSLPFQHENSSSTTPELGCHGSFNVTSSSGRMLCSSHSTLSIKVLLMEIERKVTQLLLLQGVSMSARMIHLDPLMGVLEITVWQAVNEEKTRISMARLL